MITQYNIASRSETSFSCSDNKLVHGVLRKNLNEDFSRNITFRAEWDETNPVIKRVDIGDGGEYINFVYDNNMGINLNTGSINSITIRHGNESNQDKQKEAAQYIFKCPDKDYVMTGIYVQNFRLENE